MWRAALRRAAPRLAITHHTPISRSFSHTWLGRRHPDNSDGVKKKLIAALLQAIVHGHARIHAYWMAAVLWGEKGFTSKELKKGYSDGYIWMVRLQCLTSPLGAVWPSSLSLSLSPLSLSLSLSPSLSLHTHTLSLT